MHRLIQGEVGSGKTTVAAFALWVAARQQQKSILVCPTNILASQHFHTLTTLFKGSDHPPSVGLYTGKEKGTDADILVGTHALFNLKGIKPAIVIIDEEHRFGVAQRETFFKLKKKPHFLSMTATPIPRTVALTALADRDVSHHASQRQQQ
jgi:ATP-dependent DNA helicase RecG